MHLQA